VITHAERVGGGGLWGGCDASVHPQTTVHSIMMEKLAQAGEGGGCTPTLFHYIYHHVVAVYAPAE
jgi:hypothetical protein